MTWETCRIGSCHRHQQCMYTPCRNDAGACPPRGVPPVEGPSYHGQPVPPVDYAPRSYNWDGYAGCRSVGHGDRSGRVFLDDGLAEDEVDEDRPY